MAAESSATARNVFLACAAGGFVLALAIPLGIAFWRQATRPVATVEEIEALREARLNAYRESNALQEELDRQPMPARR